MQDYLASHQTQHDLARKWCPRPYLLSRDLPFSIQVFFQQELQNFCRDVEVDKLNLRLLEQLGLILECKEWNLELNLVDVYPYLK